MTAELERFKEAEARFDAKPNKKTAEALSLARKQLEYAEAEQRRKEREANKDEFQKFRDEQTVKLWTSLIDAMTDYSKYEK